MSFNQFLFVVQFKIEPSGMQEIGLAKDILQTNCTESYTHILSAVGTGTTLAGLITAAKPQKRIIGISIFKNNLSLEEEISRLLPGEKREKFELLHPYHFGGYAKYNPELIRFMNNFFSKTGIPTDFVYTGKALYAMFDLFQKKIFSSDDKVLFIHTGGLQGNFSLAKGTLIFG